MEGQEDKEMMEAKTDRWQKKTTKRTTLRQSSFRDL